jgi:hypothetical protein
MPRGGSGGEEAEREGPGSEGACKHRDMHTPILARSVLVHSSGWIAPAAVRASAAKEGERDVGREYQGLAAACRLADARKRRVLLSRQWRHTDSFDVQLTLPTLSCQPGHVQRS